MLSQDPYWYKNALFYEVFVRSFYDSNGDGQGDLEGLRQKLDYLAALGVDCVWLLPIYQSPFKDGGYDISDYCSILPIFGSIDDFTSLVASAHEKGIRIVMDLVVNHTSDQHPWFIASRSSRNSPYRDYYVWSESDQKYADARIIFVDTEKSNWTFDPETGQYYWHRFYANQPDLNYDNPAVRAEMLKVMDFWLSLGIDGFRVDAVPYLFEREGTSCENLPETHAFLKEMRRFIDEQYPGRVLLCEANQWPREVREYLGEGDEFQMAFHFPLMPRIYMALRQGDAGSIRWVLSQTPSIPTGCQWGTFLRNHDELTLEMVSEEERQWMWQEYAPDPNMRLNLGIRRRLAPLLDNNPRKIRLAYALLFSLPGSPVNYYGDEIGMGDNISLPDRDGVRTPMQWDDSKNAGFTSSDHPHLPIIDSEGFAPKRVNAAAAQADRGSIWSTIQKMIKIRKDHPVLASGDLQIDDRVPASILAFTRFDDSEKIFVIHNLSEKAQHVEMALPVGENQTVRDLLSECEVPIREGQLSLQLQSLESCWFVVV